MERRQRAKDAMQVTMMTQSNSTVRRMFLGAEETDIKTGCSVSSFRNKILDMSFNPGDSGKRTCSGYMPVFAFVDVYVVFQVDLYPATVNLVVESNLLTRHMGVTMDFKKQYLLALKGNI